MRRRAAAFRDDEPHVRYRYERAEEEEADARRGFEERLARERRNAAAAAAGLFVDVVAERGAAAR